MARHRGGTQPTPLSADDVLDAALRVVERSGLDRLTVRAVADELGVTPPAVHYHLRGGRDLVDRVTEAVAASIEIRIDPEAPWVDQYVALVASMDRTFLRYPGTGTRVLAASRDSAAAARLTRTALSILGSADLAEPVAVEMFTATYLLFAGWLATRGLGAAGVVHPALAAAGVAASGISDGSVLERAVRRLLETPEGPVSTRHPKRSMRQEK
ncbi:TetR/AcrR family transcriptional regulator [Nocardia salmonicida]|uniref:TetR/AcrR family transcriptional regulator n=1 Tax=Nocardia salmonicida TaxID=53431 RepID=UPI0033EB2CB4